MMLAKVMGMVVATQKEPSLEGLRLMLCRPLDAQGKETGSTVVAADGVGAGPGETVLYCTGSSARQTTATDNRPVDAVIMAIVDQWDVAGQIVYRKSEDQ